MLGYTLRRLGSAIPTIFIIITLTFFAIRLAPGGPFDLERPIDPLILENLKKAYNMDAPLWQQYLIYLGNLLHGDLGPSFTRRDFSVNDLFASGLPVSIVLGTLGLTLAAIIGTFLGTLAALKQNSTIDYFVVALATFGITTPNFVVAPLLSLLFGVILGWVPAGGWSSANVTYWILPVLTL
ncbi:MAG: ABC transporter, partial [Brucella intermedia]